jgi:hypothetical protein
MSKYCLTKLQICGKVFTKNHNLIVHQRVHQGVRPYTCRKCESTFRQKAHLERHLAKVDSCIENDLNGETPTKKPTMVRKLSLKLDNCHKPDPNDEKSTKTMERKLSFQPVNCYKPGLNNETITTTTTESDSNEESNKCCDLTTATTKASETNATTESNKLNSKSVSKVLATTSAVLNDDEEEEGFNSNQIKKVKLNDDVTEGQPAAAEQEFALQLQTNSKDVEEETEDQINVEKTNVEETNVEETNEEETNEEETNVEETNVEQTNVEQTEEEETNVEETNEEEKNEGETSSTKGMKTETSLTKSFN